MKLLRERIVNLQSGIEYLFQIRDCKLTVNCYLRLRWGQLRSGIIFVGVTFLL